MFSRANNDDDDDDKVVKDANTVILIIIQLLVMAIMIKTNKTSQQQTPEDVFGTDGESQVFDEFKASNGVLFGLQLLQVHLPRIHVLDEAQLFHALLWRHVPFR